MKSKRLKLLQKILDVTLLAYICYILTAQWWNIAKLVGIKHSCLLKDLCDTGIDNVPRDCKVMFRNTF